MEKEQKDTIETVSKFEFDKLKSELDTAKADLLKANNAIQKLINAMAQRYAQDLYKEVLGE